MYIVEMLPLFAHTDHQNDICHIITAEVKMYHL